MGLCRAARLGDVDDVRRRLADGEDPNRVWIRQVPLVSAAANDRLEVVEVLAAAGADLGWRDEDGWTALTYADANGFEALTERLIELGAPVESRYLHGYNALHRAARVGDVEAIPRHVQMIGTEVRDACGNTALMIAVQFRHESCAETLLLAGADPDHVHDGRSVLTEAAYQDSIREQTTRFVERLLAAGADPNPQGYPPLFNAVNQEGSSASVFRRLVAAGAHIGALAGGDRETVLHRIAQICDDSDGMLDVAFEAGAELEARDGRGRTPLLAAASNGSDENFARLLARGADLSARYHDDEGAATINGRDDWGAMEIRALIIHHRPRHG